MFRGLLRHLQGELFVRSKVLSLFVIKLGLQLFYSYLKNHVYFNVELQMLKSFCKILSSTMKQTWFFN